MENKCDFCGKSGKGETIIDGKTIRGYWAYMCLVCHKKLGVGMGLGKGSIVYKGKGYFEKDE